MCMCMCAHPRYAASDVTIGVDELTVFERYYASGVQKSDEVAFQLKINGNLQPGDDVKLV